jgi:tetratricopeptide (TPR) repeat protein
MRVERFVLPLTLTLTIAILVIGCSERGDPLDEIRQQQAAGAYAATVEPLRKLLVERPDDPELNLLYGRALVATQRPDLAVWSLRKALADPEWLAPAGHQLALAALGARDFAGAIEITSRVLARHPEDLQALLMRANAHAHGKGEGDPEVALVDAARILELDPDAIEAYEPKILALLALHRDEEASEALAEVGERLVELEAAPSVLAWHCSTKATFEQADGLPSARETWETCLEKHPVSMEVLSGAVGYFDEQADFDRSLEVMRTAYENASASRPLRIMLADRLRGMGRATEAEALLMEATATEEPEAAAAAWMDLAGLLTTTQSYEAAADALEKALGYAREAGRPARRTRTSCSATRTHSCSPGVSTRRSRSRTSCPSPRIGT